MGNVTSCKGLKKGIKKYIKNEHKSISFCKMRCRHGKVNDRNADD